MILFVYHYALSSIVIVLILKHFLVNFLHQVVHQFINVLIKSCWRLEIAHLMLISKNFSLLSAHLALVFQVNFVSYKDLGNAGICMLVNWLQPCFHIVERLLVGHIECYYDTVCLLVERVSNCLETLLACCVPDLHCDVLGVWGFEGGWHVIQTYGGHVTLRKLLLRIPIQERFSISCTHEFNRDKKPSELKARSSLTPKTIG